MLSRNLELYANSAAAATTNVSMLRGDTDSNKPLTNVVERPPGSSFFFNFPYFDWFWGGKKWEFDEPLRASAVIDGAIRAAPPSVIFWLKGEIGEIFGTLLLLLAFYCSIQHKSCLFIEIPFGIREEKLWKERGRRR